MTNESNDNTIDYKAIRSRGRQLAWSAPDLDLEAFRHEHRQAVLDEALRAARQHVEDAKQALERAFASLAVIKRHVEAKCPKVIELADRRGTRQKGR